MIHTNFTVLEERSLRSHVSLHIWSALCIFNLHFKHYFQVTTESVLNPAHGPETRFPDASAAPVKSGVNIMESIIGTQFAALKKE